MEIQKSPNGWSCLATSYAIALGVPLNILISEIGHDGSEIIWPELPEPNCRRAFHPQEFVWSVLTRGYAPVIMEAQPTICPPTDEHCIYDVNNIKFEQVLMQFPGVLIGQGFWGKPHAVAWDTIQCFDPNGVIYGVDRFNIREFVAFVERGYCI